MLDNKGFDKWAGDYDRSISRSEKGYPFEGYYDVLAGVQSRIKEPSGKKILDIVIGTGLLTNELYKQGALVHGIDFSVEMITLAKEKMPGENRNFYFPLCRCWLKKGRSSLPISDS